VRHHHIIEIGILSASGPQKRISEPLLVFLVGAVQFVNILDFVMVMPLGPDFARALAIPASNLGYIGGAYTAAASVAGLAGSFFLDRFDRRNALAVAMLGLACGTVAGGFATDLPTLLAARVIAGLFGGPATSIAFSVIADEVPPERRGRAMGAVMGAFSAASVIGLPVGLELARHQALGGWRAPFFTTAGIGVLVTAMVFFTLPPLTRHLAAERGEHPTLAGLFREPLVLQSYLMTAVVMMAGFILIPNISAWVQENLHFPREKLGRLYLAGGVVSFFATRYGGRLVDKIGSFPTGLVATLLLLPLQYFFFVQPIAVPVVAFFMVFMLAMGLRNVAYNTLTSKVPSPSVRARFLSIQSAVQHAASASGSFLSARLLAVNPDGTLRHMSRVALIAMALTALIPFLIGNVERKVRLRGER
jgi:predicted MFS family arabinose efflux permease